MRILIVEDDAAIRLAIEEVLSDEGHSTLGAPNGNAALELLCDNDIELMITDIIMPELNGIDLLKRAKSLYPDLLVAIITSHATKHNAIEALRYGAFDYIEKPFSAIHDIVDIANTAMEKILAAQQAISPTDKLFLKKVNIILQARYMDPEFDVAELYDRLGMQERSAQRKIKSITESNPREYIYAYRVERARDAIASGTINKEVAKACGFNDVYQMNRWFKKIDATRVYR